MSELSKDGGRWAGNVDFTLREVRLSNSVFPVTMCV